MTQKELTMALEQIRLPEEKRRQMIDLLASKKASRRCSYSYAAVCAAVLLCGLAILLPRQNTVLQPEVSSAVAAVPSSNTVENPLVFNKLKKQPDQVFQLFALMADDFHAMTAAALEEYYGASFPAELPGGLTQQEITSPGGGPGIFQRKSGEIYFDGNLYVYGDSEKKKMLTVTVAKGHLPYMDINEAYDHPLTQSEINGIPITAASYTDTNGQSLLYAEFLFQGNGYFLYANNISTDAFLQILLVLIGEG